MKKNNFKISIEGNLENFKVHTEATDITSVATVLSQYLINVCNEIGMDKEKFVKTMQKCYELEEERLKEEKNDK